MPFVKGSELVTDASTQAPLRSRPSSSVALATAASLLPLVMMLVMVFVVPRYFAAWATQIPLTADFGSASIVGMAIISAALVVGYVLVAINEGVTDAALEERQAQALVTGFESRERLEVVRQYLARTNQ